MAFQSIPAALQERQGADGTSDLVRLFWVGQVFAIVALVGAMLGTLVPAR